MQSRARPGPSPVKTTAATATSPTGSVGPRPAAAGTTHVRRASSVRLANPPPKSSISTEEADKSAAQAKRVRVLIEAVQMDDSEVESPKSSARTGRSKALGARASLDGKSGVVASSNKDSEGGEKESPRSKVHCQKIATDKVNEADHGEAQHSSRRRSTDSKASVASSKAGGGGGGGGDDKKSTSKTRAKVKPPARAGGGGGSVDSTTSMSTATAGLAPDDLPATAADVAAVEAMAAKQKEQDQAKQKEKSDDNTTTTTDTKQTRIESTAATASTVTKKEPVAASKSISTSGPSSAGSLMAGSFESDSKTSTNFDDRYFEWLQRLSSTYTASCCIIVFANCVRDLFGSICLRSDTLKWLVDFDTDIWCEMRSMFRDRLRETCALGESVTTKAIKDMWAKASSKPRGVTVSAWDSQYSLVVDGATPFGGGFIHKCAVKVSDSIGVRYLPLLVKRLKPAERKRIERFVLCVESSNLKIGAFSFLSFSFNACW